MNRCFKKYYVVFLCITAFILTLLAVSQQFAQESHLYPPQERQMNSHQEWPSNAPISSQVSSNEPSVINLHANEFIFESHLEFPPFVKTNPDKFTESITQNNNGAIDMALINQGNTVKYIFHFSSIPQQQCQSSATRACQQGAAAPARGNVAEVQITLPGSKLMPGNYTFGTGGATPREEVIIYSRQLYSDPAHGKLGCQSWGGGALNIKRAIYNGNDNLEYLEASLFRVCNQTTPFPPTRLEDNLLQGEAENIEKYTYRASWRCRMQPTRASQS